MDDVLHPCEVGISNRRSAVLPSGIIAEALAAAVAHVQCGIGQDEIGLEVFVQIIMEGMGPIPGPYKCSSSLFPETTPASTARRVLPETQVVEERASFLTLGHLAS
jgi:hypothetical protein